MTSGAIKMNGKMSIKRINVKVKVKSIKSIKLKLKYSRTKRSPEKMSFKMSLKSRTVS